VLRALAAAAALVALGVLARSWVPPRNYRPIGPHDRGTVVDAVVTGGTVLSGHDVVDREPVAPQPSDVPASGAPVATTSAVPSGSATPAAAIVSPTPPATTPPATTSPTPSATESPTPTATPSASVAPTAG
jgi:hypothetical protein